MATADVTVRSGRLTTLTVIPKRGMVQTHLAFKHATEPLCGSTFSASIVERGTYLWARRETRCTKCDRLAELLAPQHIPA